MENILSQIVLGQKETTKALNMQTKMLGQMLKLEDDRADLERKRFNAEKRNARRQKKQASDMNPLQAILGDKKDAKKRSKSFFDQIGDMIGGLFGGLGALGILKALGLTAIGGTIAAYFASPQFQKFVNGLVQSMFSSLGQAVSNLGERAMQGLGLRNQGYAQRTSKGAPITAQDIDSAKISVTEASKDSSLNKEQREFMSQMMRNLEEIEKRRENIGNMQKQLDEANERKVKAETRLAEERLKENPNEKIISTIEKNLSKGDEQRTALETNIEQSNQVIRNMLTVTKPDGKEDSKLMLEFINMGREHRGETPFTLEDFQRKQKGGHINVPGSGSGDKVPFMLPGGSFVMNRNAAAMLQSGGMVPTLLEPGEKVFGPGSWGPMEMMMNNTFGRFQEGGKVDPKAGAKTDSESEKFSQGTIKSGPITPGGYIDFIGDGSGFTGELRFMDGSGKTVGSYGGVSGVARTAGATQEQRKNVSGVLNPIADGTYALQTPMGPGSAAVGSFAAWVGDPNGNVPNNRGQIFLHNDIGSDGTQGCIGVELGGARGPNAQTEKFVDFYNKVQPNKVAVNLQSSSGKRFGPGDLGNNSGGGGGAMGYLGGLFGAVGGLGAELIDTFLTVFGLGDIKELANMGAPEPVQPASGGPGGTSANVTPGAKGLLDFIASYESGGDYNKMYGGESKDGLTEMTIREVIAYQHEHLKRFPRSAAAGRYQMMKPELHMKDAGLNMDSLFSPENQDKMAMAYLEDDGWSNFKNGSMSSAAFAKNVSGTWAALPKDASGAGTYDGDGVNKALVGYDKFIAQIEASKMQTGGIANVGGTASAPTTSMLSKSQEQFAEKIAEATTPIVLPMGGGGGGGGMNIVEGSTGNDVTIPSLPSNDSSVVAMEYKYRITMGASV